MIRIKSLIPDPPLIDVVKSQPAVNAPRGKQTYMRTGQPHQLPTQDQYHDLDESQ